MQTTLLTSRAAEWESATFADKAEVCESSGALEALRATPGRGSQDGRRVREDELTLDKDEDKGELALDVDGVRMSSPWTRSREATRPTPAPAT